MEKNAWQKRYIFNKLACIIIILVVLQSVLFGAFLLFGGVLGETRSHAYDNFEQVVSNRAGFLQGEMKNRWSEISLYAQQISEQLPLLKEGGEQMDSERFLTAAEPLLYEMLRATQATDVFVVLKDDAGSGSHAALYFRDEDPLIGNELRKDVSMLAGPMELTKQYTTVDDLWSYKLILTAANEAFYKKPYEMAQTVKKDVKPLLLGYWCPPFQLYPEDERRIAYSMPLKDAQGEVYGVIGVGISLSHLYRYLPAADLAARDSFGYLLVRREEGGVVTPIAAYGAYQKRMIDLTQPLRLEMVQGRSDIFTVQQKNGDSLYACAAVLNPQEGYTPYKEEPWMLLGLQRASNLLVLLNRIEGILWLSFFVSLLLGVLCGGVVSYYFTRPIVRLAEKVRHSNPLREEPFAKTGFHEIDQLVEAIAVGNRNIAEGTRRIARAMELANAPIGVFHYNRMMPQVMATSRLQEIFSLTDAEAEDLYSDKQRFMNRLDLWMKVSADDHEHVYQISDDPEKWVKINVLADEDETLGIALDVTEEYQEAQALRKERDYDMLTQLLGRRCFRDRVERVIAQGDLRNAAMVMLDLDCFKKVNDTYGHAWGDEYLKIVARQLQEIPGNSCIVGRRSGDEFFVFSYDFASRDEIRQMFDHFYRTLQNNPIRFPDNTLRTIAFSAGLAWFDPAEPDYDKLLERADQALYAVKKTQPGRLGEENFLQDFLHGSSPSKQSKCEERLHLFR